MFRQSRVPVMEKSEEAVHRYRRRSMILSCNINRCSEDVEPNTDINDENFGTVAMGQILLDIVRPEVGAAGSFSIKVRA